MKEILWLENEKPSKLWKTLDVISIIMILVTIIVGSLVIILVPKGQLLFGFILLIIIVIIESIVFSIVHLRNRKIWPIKVGISNEEIIFQYLNGKSTRINWADVNEVKILFKKEQDRFAKFVDFPEHALIVNKHGTFIKADIYGKAAIEIYNYFKEHKKQLQKLGQV